MSKEIQTKLRKGDEVIVRVGKSRGKIGKIDKIDGDRVYVAGCNLVKRHQRADVNNPDGGIIDKAKSIHISNVALVDPKTRKATRIGFSVVDGKKNRVAKKSGTALSAS